MRRRAHPRSRGENAHGNRIGHMQSGSSPLTRGKLEEVRAHVRRVGLIPAHAGKTGPFRPVPTRPESRLIPSHAGKTAPFPPTATSLRAHPHSRGENFEWFAQGKWWTGSSPLTRGKHERERRGLLRFGLIPTHAGKTLPDLRFYRADRSDLGKP